MNSDLVGWWSVRHAERHAAADPCKTRIMLSTQIAVSDETKAFLMNLGGDPFPGNSKMLKEFLIKDTKAWAGICEGREDRAAVVVAVVVARSEATKQSSAAPSGMLRLARNEAKVSATRRPRRSRRCDTSRRTS